MCAGATGESRSAGAKSAHTGFERRLAPLGWLPGRLLPGTVGCLSLAHQQHRHVGRQAGRQASVLLLQETQDAHASRLSSLVEPGIFGGQGPRISRRGPIAKGTAGAGTGGGVLSAQHAILWRRFLSRPGHKYSAPADRIRPHGARRCEETQDARRWLLSLFDTTADSVSFFFFFFLF